MQSIIDESIDEKMKRKNKIGKNLEKKASIFGITSGVSGFGGVISAHNICHSVCLAVVAVLSFFGIIVSSDILMWLEDYNLLFWGMGIIFLLISLALFVKFPRCMPTKLIVFNAGLLVIGFPFSGSWSSQFLVIGVAMSGLAVLAYVNDKFLVERKLGRKRLKKYFRVSEKHLTYFIIIILVIASGAFLYAYLSSLQYGANNYNTNSESISGESSICETPEGYTDEEWREHMSHHPDMYAQCL